MEYFCSFHSLFCLGRSRGGWRCQWKHRASNPQLLALGERGALRKPKGVLEVGVTNTWGHSWTFPWASATFPAASSSHTCQKKYPLKEITFFPNDLLEKNHHFGKSVGFLVVFFSIRALENADFYFIFSLHFHFFLSFSLSFLFLIFFSFPFPKSGSSGPPIKQKCSFEWEAAGMCLGEAS